MAETSTKKPRAVKEKAQNISEPVIEKTISKDDLLDALKNNPDILQSIRENVISEMEMKTAKLSNIDESKIIVTCFYDLSDGGQIHIPYGGGLVKDFDSYGQQIRFTSEDFERFAMSPIARELLISRILVAEGNGISDYTKAACKLDYKEGEIASRDFMYRVLDTDFDKVLSLIPHLCEAHIGLIASAYYKAVRSGNNKVSRDKLLKLDTACKKSTDKAIFGNVLTLYNEIHGENSI